MALRQHPYFYKMLSWYLKVQLCIHSWVGVDSSVESMLVSSAWIHKSLALANNIRSIEYIILFESKDAVFYWVRLTWFHWLLRFRYSLERRYLQRGVNLRTTHRGPAWTTLVFWGEHISPELWKQLNSESLILVGKPILSFVEVFHHEFGDTS